MYHLKMYSYLLQYCVTLYLFTLYFTGVKCHPQCLDFRPPFQVESGLKFCPEYASFGCCSIERDHELMIKHQSIMSQVGRTTKSQCTDLVRQVMCLECNPYAAHLYDAEATLIVRPLPGLCPNFCEEFYDTCSSVVNHLTDDPDTLVSSESKLIFCDYNRILDEDYCYPHLLTNPVLQYNISKEGQTVDGCICLEEFASGLRNPLLLRVPPDGTQRLFIAEQIGEVHIYFPNGTKVEEPFLNLTRMLLTSTWTGDERGFLGMAFHPQYSENGRLFVYYSSIRRSKHYSILSEFLVDENNPNKVDENSQRVLLELEQPQANHNGGELMFDLDGHLLLFLGDGGGGGDPSGYAQNLNSLLGKALRLDVDSPPVSGSEYTVPDDNPFLNTPHAQPEIYAYGIRNIWRCDLDEGDSVTGYGKGRIICGDVGQNAYEEIDVIKKGGNYGWNAREGFECYKRDLCGRIGDEELPIHAYPHSVGKSVTGGHVYRGCLNPRLQGKYIFGDFMNGKLFQLDEHVESGKWSSQQLFTCGSDICFNGLTGNYETSILSFGEDADGEIYMLTTSLASTKTRAGKVYKLIDPRRRGDPSTCRTYVPPELVVPSTEAPVHTTSSTTADQQSPKSVEDDDVYDIHTTTSKIPHSNVNSAPSLHGLPITTCVLFPVIHCVTYHL